MTPKTTEQDFASLVRHAGLPLGDAQRASLYEVWHAVEAMLERVRTPAPGADEVAAAAAEPAVTYRAERGA